MLRPVVCALSMSGWLAVGTLAMAQFPGGMGGAPPGNYPASFPAPSNPGNFPAPGLPPPADAQAYNQALNPQGPPTATAPQPRQLIVDVQILGVDQTREHLVQKHLHTRKDREFDPELVQSDVRRLVTSGLFKDVKTYTRQVPQGVIVIYEIFERPRIRHIKHIGNRGMSEKKLAKEHGLKVGDPLNAYSAEEGRRKIEELYRKNGYPKTQVSIMEGDKPADKGLVYFINEGNLERIESVSFRGNTVASDSRLKTQIESKPAGEVIELREQEFIAAEMKIGVAVKDADGFFRGPAKGPSILRQ